MGKTDLRKLSTLLTSVLYGLAILIAPLTYTTAAHADTFDFVFLSSTPPKVDAHTTATFMINSMFHLPVLCKIDSEDYSPCAMNPFTTSELPEGTHTFSVHAEGASNPESTATYTWTIAKPPELVGSNALHGGVGVPTSIHDLQVQDSGNNTVAVQLSVPSGSLIMSTTTGLTITGPQSGPSLTFFGPRSDVNTALATLTYTATELDTVTLNARILGADGEDYDTISGRVFKVVRSEETLTWAQAKAAAEASSYGGATGYLASITSAEQNAFVNERMIGGTWIGGNDLGNEGDWQWSGGPESGQSFWSGDAEGSAVNDAYTPWHGGMPDNYNNEDCLETGHSDTTADWNDQNCDAGRRYYVVEYGDGETIPYVSAKQVSLYTSEDTDGDGLADTDEAAGPNNGDANNDGIPDLTQANVSSRNGVAGSSYVVVQTSCTTNADVEASSESSQTKDAGYDYPLGLVSFLGFDCGEPGGLVNVTQYYFGSNNSSTPRLRKWNPITQSYSTVADADISQVRIGGQDAIKVTYAVTDGGALDMDQIADTNIDDPVGLGFLVVGVPNTGLGRRQ